MPDTYQKQALGFEDQLALLQQRGLEFDDLDRALSQIRAISYYRLSGYWYPFREKDTDGNLTDKFIHSASFENAIELYEFDRTSIISDVGNRACRGLPSHPNHLPPWTYVWGFWTYRPLKFSP